MQSVTELALLTSVLNKQPFVRFRLLELTLVFNEKHSQGMRVTIVLRMQVNSFTFCYQHCQRTNRRMWLEWMRLFVICWNLCLAIQKIFDRHLKPVIGPTS